MNDICENTKEIMDIGVFADMVKEVLEEQYRTAKIHIRKNLKNNGTENVGIFISERDCNVAPCINLEDFYKRFQRGESLSAVCKTIMEIHESKKGGFVDGDKFKDFDMVKERICFKLVNAEMNRELLQNIPFVQFMDLALVFYILISDDESGIASITINNNMMNIWNTNETVLRHYAKENTQKLLQARVLPMTEMFPGIMGVDSDCPFIDEVPNSETMHIVSNRSGVNGAVAMLYDGVLQSFAEKIDNNYYILLSSIHEVIFMPDLPYITGNDLLDMVYDINKTMVLPEEVLSNNVYYYDRNRDCINLITRK